MDGNGRLRGSFCRMESERSSVVELHLAKVDVEGSNPFARSNYLTEGAGGVAQLVEQLTLNQRVVGSSPSTSTSVILIKQAFSPLSMRVS